MDVTECDSGRSSSCSGTCYEWTADWLKRSGDDVSVLSFDDEKLQVTYPEELLRAVEAYRSQRDVEKGAHVTVARFYPALDMYLPQDYAVTRTALQRHVRKLIAEQTTARQDDDAGLKRVSQLMLWSQPSRSESDVSDAESSGSLFDFDDDVSGSLDERLAPLVRLRRLERTRGDVIGCIGRSNA